jgi:hypothetical protein
VILSELDLATPETQNPPDVTKYRSRIGSTLWLSRGGLPIVGYQVGALARFNHAPGKKHWDASSDMIRFIATSVDARICFKRTGKPLYYHVDSDFLPSYGTAFDNRRSTTGYCSYLAGACASHCSRRQTTAATSTAHAEYLLAAFGLNAAGARLFAFECCSKTWGFRSWEQQRYSKTTKLVFGCQKPNHRRHRVLSTSMCGITGYVELAVVHDKSLRLASPLFNYGDGCGCTHETTWLLRN